ncbi:hypothetical protein O0L34_g8802 [Tuta absoluta]|nr:hypothetical protein O0L34_g8802 [Tuta absoluta]
MNIPYEDDSMSESSSIDVVGPQAHPLESQSVVSWIIETILLRVAKRTRVLKRWRKPNPGEWSRNIAKKRRAEGLPYVTNKKLRNAKLPKNVDCSNCSYKCNSNFDDEARLKLCRHYWSLDFKSKKAFILANIKVQHTKRVLVIRRSYKKARQYSKKNFFPSEETRKPVCQKFFLKTLSISLSVITDAIEKRDSVGLFSSEDQRGKHTPVNKTNERTLKRVKDHIESFPTMDPHYIRSTSRRKYLDKSLSIKKMYDLYVEQCEKDLNKANEEVEEGELNRELNNGETGDAGNLEYELESMDTKAVSEMTYRRIFASEYNLSFFVYKKDQCKICTKYDKASLEEKEGMEELYSEHIARKETIFDEKQNDKKRANEEENFVSATFDLQAVLQIPSGLVGELYYSRKICVYNLCVYEAALPNDAYYLAWSEINGKRGSCEIGTVLYHYLSKCVPVQVDEVCLYSDTCGGQNRNQFICALLLLVVQTIAHIKIIDHKFMESGHSYMEVDSMHSAIENAKKHATIFAMPDLLTIFRNARKKQTVKTTTGQKITKENYKVKEFKYNEFYDLKSLASSMFVNPKKDSEGNPVKWMKIKQFRYLKEEPHKVFFRYDLKDDKFFHIIVKDTSEGKQTRRSTRASTRVNAPEPPLLKQLYDRQLPITEAKKKDLLKLCKTGTIPEELHGWYSSLRTEEDEVDRIPEPATEEDSETE